jgi:hypothetical protein
MKVNKIEKITILNNLNQWLGYKIKITDSSKNIICKIENEQHCCERFGVYTKNELNDFIGAEYYSVNIGKIVFSNSDYNDYMKTIKISINTNKGKINIQFYNEHNGYYCHDVFIQTENGIKNISL